MLSLTRKLWALLNRRERRQLAGLAALVVGMGLAQVVGIGSIAPFVSVLVSPDSVQTNVWLQWAFTTFGFDSTNAFLVFLGLAFLAALVVANGFMVLTQWTLIHFGWSLQYRLSHRLLQQYLYQPYVAFIQRNSADAGKNILEEVERLTTGVVHPLLRVIAFSVAGLSVLFAMLWAIPVLPLAVIVVLGGGYAVVYFAVRRTLAQAGQRRIRANTDRFKVVSEAFGSIKETKVLGRESALLDQYDRPAKQFAQTQSTQQVIVQIPRYALEVFTVGVMLTLVMVLLQTSGQDIEDIAPLLSLYAFAAFRLMPIFQMIYQGASQLRFNSIVVAAIYDDMVGTPAGSQPRRSTNGQVPVAPMVAEKTGGHGIVFDRELRLEGITFTYPGADVPAVENISVSIPHHSFVAFVGSTGAGKTTLIDIILGLLEAEKGTLSVDGTALDGTNIRAWQDNLGYVPQEIYLVDDSISSNIAFAIAPEDRRQEAIESAARIANIHDFIMHELPNRYDTIVGERGVRLSGGQRQRIGIARALYHDPGVLVLDEATSNLDQATEAAVHEAIEQAAAVKTVIMIAHRLSVTRNCDVLYLLDHGRIVADGSYDSLVLNSDRFRAMAGKK